MSRRAHAFIIDVSEAFRRTGAVFIIFKVAPLIWRTFGAILEESRLCNEGNVAALSTSSWAAVGARSIKITAITDASSGLILYERTGTATNCTLIVRIFVRWTRNTTFWII